MDTFQIGEFQIGGYLNPYIIAEVGVNYEGSIEKAKEMIKDAADSGAHCVKFQSYKAEKIASKKSPAYWDLNSEPTTSQFELFKKYDQFGPGEYEELADFCDKNNVDFCSTPFDSDAVDFLDPLMKFYKIASADITNTPLLRKVASKGKPVVMSTGASTKEEIEFACQVLKNAGSTNICLLHCVLNYPTPIDNAGIGYMKTLMDEFSNYSIGYSDHVQPDETISALELAAVMGATILEKHFTFDKSLPGNDHYHAMDKIDLLKFCDKLNLYKSLTGNFNKNLKLEEKARLHARRSICAMGNIAKGETITEDKIIPKRPGHGISPIHWDEILGKTAKTDIEDDTPLQWDMLH